MRDDTGREYSMKPGANVLGRELFALTDKRMSRQQVRCATFAASRRLCRVSRVHGELVHLDQFFARVVVFS